VGWHDGLFSCQALAYCLEPLEHQQRPEEEARPVYHGFATLLASVNSGAVLVAAVAYTTGAGIASVIQ